MDDHERVTRGRPFSTASLIANSAKAIVLLGGHDTETAELAYDYGRHLGLAFQFQDDVLDFVGTGSVLGKPTLGDLREGIATAPVLFAAEEFPGRVLFFSISPFSPFPVRITS